MRCDSDVICARFDDTVSTFPRCKNATALSAYCWIAINGWFNSWLIPADICPNADSFPARTKSSWARRSSNVRSLTRRSKRTFASAKARRRCKMNSKIKPKKNSAPPAVIACKAAMRRAGARSTKASACNPMVGRSDTRCSASLGTYGPQFRRQIS